MSKLYLLIVPIFVALTIPAYADPITVVVNAVMAAGAGYAATGAILSMTTLGYFTAFMALSALSKALAPDMPDMSTQGGYDVSGPDPAANQQVIYGETRVGGVVVFKDTSDDGKYLHQVIAIAGHECEAITSVYFDDLELVNPTNSISFLSQSGYPDGVQVSVTGARKIGTFDIDTTYNDLVRVTAHLGREGQTVDTNLSSAIPAWTSNHKLLGITYMYIRLEHDADVFTSGEPRITFKVKGKKVYNPVSGVTEWSTNPALCLRDYLTNDDYGLGCEDDEIDDTTFAQAANDCIKINPTAAPEYTFDSSSTSPSGISAGQIRFSVSEIFGSVQFNMYIATTDANGVNRQSFIDSLDANNPTANFLGQRYILDISQSDNLNNDLDLYSYNVTDYTGYSEILVVRIGGVYGNYAGVNALQDGVDYKLTKSDNVSSSAIYKTNGAFLTDATHENVINAIATSAAGNAFYSLGKFQFYAGAPRTATVSLNEDDLRSGIEIQTKRSRRELYNELGGIFKGAENAWQKSDYPPVITLQGLAEDGNYPSRQNIDLLFTSTSRECKRIAKILLLKTRQQVQIKGTFGLKAANLTAGEWVTFSSNRLGIDDTAASATFEVASWSISPNTTNGVSFDVVLQEISDVVYAWTSEEEPPEINPSIVNDTGGRFVATLNVQTSFSEETINEHVIAVLKVNVTTPDSTLLDGCIVQYKLTSEGDDTYKTIGQGSLGEFFVRDIPAGDYTVRAQAVNTNGVRGSYNTTTISISSSDTTPDDVEDLSVNVNEGYTNLEWTPVESKELSYYVVRHAEETTGANFSNATTEVKKVPRPATSVTVPTRSGTYMIRPYDKLDKPSLNPTSVVIDGNVIPSSYSNSATAVEATTFNGTSEAGTSNVSVSSGRLELTSYGTAPSTGTYIFSNDIDIGATSGPSKCRVSMACAVQRSSDSSLWDSLDPETNLDSLSGLWDDLTGGTDLLDTDVDFFISTTPDDPSGTPTWSDYKQFKAGDFYGRGFRFMVKLHSTASGVTPSIGTLTAKVEYN
mgnify:FL=1